MANVKYRFSKVLKGIRTWAYIELEIKENELGKVKVKNNVEEIPLQSQGMIEGGHDIWVSCAANAIYAFFEALKPEEGFDIIIKKIEGRILIDTNNASVGIACILGLMQFFDLTFSESKYLGIDEFISENWKADIEEIPDFKKIL